MPCPLLCSVREIPSVPAFASKSRYMSAQISPRRRPVISSV